MTRALWIKNGLVYTGGRKPEVIPGGVLCRGPDIEQVGPDADLVSAATLAQARVVDAGGRLIGPGFINAHMHLYSTLARGLCLQGEPPADFDQILARLWWRLDRALTLEDLTPSAELPLIEALEAGVTTVIDHHASPLAIDGSLDVLAEAAQRLGVRFATCYEVSDRDGGAVCADGIAENLRFAREVRGQTGLGAMFGLHASFTLKDETLEVCAAAAAEADLPVHVHVAEGASDQADARSRGARSSVERLWRAGLLRPRSLAIHCVHTDAADWDLLREAGVFAVHNPQSNMNNAVGAAPVARMLERGLSVGLGTDGMEADVREEVRAAFLLGHQLSGDPRTMWTEIGEMLLANAAIASALFGCRLGELSPGAAADLVVWDYHPPTALAPENFLGHLVFGLYRARAYTTVVAGEVRLEAGQVVGVDAAEVAARARERAARLWARI